MFIITSLLFAFSTIASATPYALPLSDKGTELKEDPYVVNPTYSEGKFEGFRELYVEPDAFSEKLKPQQVSEGTAKASLVILNDSSAYVDVHIGGDLVGRIGPLVEAKLHGIAAGTYEVSMTLPNGHQVVRTLKTE